MASYFRNMFSVVNDQVPHEQAVYVPPASVGPPMVVKKKKTTRLGVGRGPSGQNSDTCSVISDHQPVPVQEIVVRQDPESVEESKHPQPEEGVSVAAEMVSSEAERATVPGTDSILPRLLREQGSLMEREKELEKMHAEIETEISMLMETQNQFCEIEDYENADLVDGQIEQLRLKILAVERELFLDIPGESVKLRVRFVDQLRNICEMENKILLSNRTQLKQHETEFSQKHAQLVDRLAEMESVDLKFKDREDLIRERKLDLELRTQKIEEQISTESDHIVNEKIEAERDWERLDALVTDLQRQLAEAMEARSDCAKILSASELKLKNIRSQFQDDFEELREDEEALQSQTESLMQDKIAAGGGDSTELRQELKEMQTEHEMHASRASMEISTAELWIKEMDNFHKILSEYDRLVTQLTQPLEAARSRLIESAEFRIFLSESVAAIESEISAFKKSVKHGSQERIPQLEEAKRVAIENRSFKEAKELNDELKSIVDELAVSDEKLNSLKSKLANTRNALRDARSAETEARQRLMEIEVGFSNRRTDLLCRYREQLSEFLKNSQCQDVKDLALNTLRISEPHPQVACNNPDQQAMDDRESVTEEQTVEIETAESTLEISDNNDDDEG